MPLLKNPDRTTGKLPSYSSYTMDINRRRSVFTIGPDLPLECHGL